MVQTRDIQIALEIFRQHEGVMKTNQALMQGIHPAALYRLLEDGTIMRLARGLYRLTSTQEFSNPDLAVVAAKAPDAVVCLISALSFRCVSPVPASESAIGKASVSRAYCGRIASWLHTWKA